MSRMHPWCSRKQRLHCNQDRRNVVQTATNMDAVERADEGLDISTPPTKTMHSINAPKKTSNSRDRQVEVGRNEQKLGRRRELAIPYEMIRTCLSEDDIHKYLDRAPKSPSRLSYLQIPQIACKTAEEGAHDMSVLESVASQCEALEQECRRRGISFAEGPPRDALMQRHRVIARAAHKTLLRDKE